MESIKILAAKKNKPIICTDKNDLGVTCRLFSKCEVMVDYLIDDGKKVSENVVNVLESVSNIVRPILDKLNTETADQEISKENIYKQIEEVISPYAGRLAAVHSTLSEMVKPATPQSIEFTTPTIHMPFSQSKTIPFLRNLLVATLSVFILFIVCQVFLRYKFWTDLFAVLNQVFAAALGAYFYSLYTANRYLVRRTFDPKYIMYYNNRIVIGIIAGYIFPFLINPGLINDNKEIINSLQPSVIALLGGFSSDVVIRIMNRVLAMLQALVQGEAKDIVESREQELNSKFEVEKIKTNIEAVKTLSGMLGEEKISDDMKNRLNELITKMVGGTGQQS